MFCSIDVIGMGAGCPGHITHEATEALAKLDCVFALDKGEVKDDLLAVRREILRRHAPGVPIVTIPDPPRDRQPGDYVGEVRRWHQARAQRIDAAIVEHVPDGGRLGFLVWGDPSLYDSTLRVLDSISTPHDVRVYPGIMAVQALTAAHKILLNRIGEAIHITTGRQLPTTTPENRRNCVVMLDGGAAWSKVEPENTTIYWGAYLGTDKEVLRSGRLANIGAELEELKKQLRAQHGWIMDIYLLRADDERS